MVAIIIKGKRYDGDWSQEFIDGVLAFVSRERVNFGWKNERTWNKILKVKNILDGEDIKVSHDAYFKYFIGLSLHRVSLKNTSITNQKVLIQYFNHGIDDYVNKTESVDKKITKKLVNGLLSANYRRHLAFHDITKGLLFENIKQSLSFTCSYTFNTLDFIMGIKFAAEKLGFVYYAIDRVLDTNNWKKYLLSEDSLIINKVENI